jgi:hypothetical protein
MLQRRTRIYNTIIANRLIIIIFNNNIILSYLDIIKEAVGSVRICCMYIRGYKKKYIETVRTKKKKK